MQITADVSKISKTVQADLTFIVHVLSEPAFILSSFQQFFLKRILLVSYKVVCFLAGTCKGICSYNLVCNFLIQLCHYKVQFLWFTFQMHFGMGTKHFYKLVLRMKLFLSLQSLICHIANIRVCENIFSTCSLSKSKFLTRVALVSNSCRSCRTRVVQVWHSCCKIDQIVAFYKTEIFAAFYITIRMGYF